MTDVGIYVVLIHREGDEEPWLAYVGDTLSDAQSHIRFWGPENTTFYKQENDQ